MACGLMATDADRFALTKSPRFRDTGWLNLLLVPVNDTTHGFTLLTVTSAFCGVHVKCPILAPSTAFVLSAVNTASVGEKRFWSLRRKH